ncbi:MAG: retropepsin-like aspartic protease [Flavobacteriaceae bacterium]|nr:retropepsin-like aspartic protease [Flavobacteriaceae bacterium]
MALKKHLEKQGYHSVKLKKTKTNHFELKAKINGRKGRFIIDTGASNSCVGLEEALLFDLITEASDHKATGAGNAEIDTQISQNNKLSIDGFKLKKVDLVLLDLSHINNALVKQKAKPVNGIIGADVLERGKAIIDYNKKRLYLLR